MATAIKQKLASLLTVKTFVTSVLTLVFAYLAIVGRIDAPDFMTVFMVVITFYFAKDKETVPVVKKEE